MGRKGMLSQIHTTGQKERSAYLFKSISIYYENTAVLHSSHRLKSLVYFWCKKHNTCRNTRFIEAVFHSCICVQLPRTTKHILQTKDLKIPRSAVVLFCFSPKFGLLYFMAEIILEKKNKERCTT